MIEVSLETQGFKRKTRALATALGRAGRRLVLRRLGRRLRDAVRRRFTTQGNGQWAPLSTWTKATTGRNKALLGYRRHIQFRLEGEDAVTIYFDPPRPGASIGGFHKGFVSPAVPESTYMAFNAAKPRLVGRSGNPIVFTRRKASVIPARRIWLTPAETRAAMAATLDAYADELENA